jgi:hypothetical protein
MPDDDELKKLGRPQKHFIDQYNITVNEDGSFFCHHCSRTFKWKPERHYLDNVRCRLARAEAKLKNDNN